MGVDDCEYPLSTLYDEEQKKCGMNMSSFIRGKVFHEGNRILRNPELIAAVREVNEEISRICVAVIQFTAVYPPQVDIEELRKLLRNRGS